MRWRRAVVVGALFVFVAGCADSPPPPATGTTESSALPTGDWPTGPWPEGVDRAAVDAAVDTAFADGGPLRVRAIVVIRRGNSSTSGTARTRPTSRTR